MRDSITIDRQTNLEAAKDNFLLDLSKLDDNTLDTFIYSVEFYTEVQHYTTSQAITFALDDLEITPDMYEEIW